MNIRERLSGNEASATAMRQINPDVVAAFLVEKMLTNTKNNAHIEWLTNGKAAWRFMTAGFNKRDFFKED